MIKSARRFLKCFSDSGPVEAETGEDDIIGATAALLMEAARSDHHVDEIEQQAIARLIQEKFSLDSNRAGEITARAAQQTEQATSLYPFTRLINEGCSYEEKVDLLRMLWQVAYADGHKDAHEEHLIRKLAGLLHIPHKEFIRTRLSVETSG